MAKKKKTREEKILADTRRLQQMKSSPFTYTLPQKESSMQASVLPPPPSTHVILTNQYAYVLGDVRKTLFLTTSILIVQFILFYFTK